MKTRVLVLSLLLLSLLVAPLATTAGEAVPDATAEPVAEAPSAARAAAPTPAPLFVEDRCEEPEAAMADLDPLADAQARACTPSECRAGCEQPGCFAYCVDQLACICDVICF